MKTKGFFGLPVSIVHYCIPLFFMADAILTYHAVVNKGISEFNPFIAPIIHSGGHIVMMSVLSMIILDNINMAIKLQRVHWPYSIILFESVVIFFYNLVVVFA